MRSSKATSVPRSASSVRELITSAESTSVSAASNASALVLRGSDLQALADNPEDLATDLQALAGPSAGPSGGSIYIDGFTGGQLPSKEAIREIRINQNPFSPEYDKLGYGRIEILTKPGTDHYRGTIDYNFAHDVMLPGSKRACCAGADVEAHPLRTTPRKTAWPTPARSTSRT